MKFVPLADQPTIFLFAGAFTALCLWGWWRASKAEGRNAVVRWLRRALIGVALTIAVLGPSVIAEETEVASNVEFVFAVDRTGSMAAEDGVDGETRLNAVRRDITAILESTAGARYAVLTWDSDARVELPFTTDASAVQSFADLLHQEISEFSAGSAGYRPVGELFDLLYSAEEQRPENIRYLLVFTDGETTLDPDSADPEAYMWGELASLIDGGVVLGYGTEEGGPMRTFGAGGSGLGEYMTDPESPGNPLNDEGVPLAISRIDEEALRLIADDLGVDLVINPSAEDSAAIGANLMANSEQIGNQTGLRSTYRYVVWIPATIAGLLLAWEAASFGRKTARMRRAGAL